ncbi:hypothetical protein EFU53_002957 [Vibrio cholerae]
MFKRKKILIIGDSHSLVFNSLRMRIKLAQYNIKVCSVGGATASGLENPNSKTQAYPIFKSFYDEEHSTAHRIIVSLGEVDTGFVIWYRAMKYGASENEMLDIAVKNYQTFLRNINKDKNLICISTPLPTIGDNLVVGEVANKRKEIKANQLERTRLTLEFNKRIKTFCHLENIIYVDLDAFSISTDGIVKKELLNANPFDHHYSTRAYSNILAKALRPLL